MKLSNNTLMWILLIVISLGVSVSLSGGTLYFIHVLFTFAPESLPSLFLGVAFMFWVTLSMLRAIPFKVVKDTKKGKKGAV